MRVIHSFENTCLAPEPTAVALGFFDGIHIGHARVIDTMRRAAKAKHLVPTVFTFDESPIALIQPGSAPAKLISEKGKVDLLASYGVDTLYSIPFTRDIMSMSAESYVEDLIIARLGAKLIVSGADHRFGKHATGDASLLRHVAQLHGVDVRVVDTVSVDGRAVSSTAIRRLIEGGDVATAASMLGREYSLSGEVVRGKQLGHTIGTPTANILPPGDMAMPSDGVYISEVLIGDPSLSARHSAVTNVGSNPTVDGDHVSIESHILGWDGDIYGQRLTVNFIAKIRDEQKFDSLDELKQRIKLDIEECKSYFSRTFFGLS
jgi:riboflavin kinase/FMN adenylyltransferase